MGHQLLLHRELFTLLWGGNKALHQFLCQRSQSLCPKCCCTKRSHHSSLWGVGAAGATGRAGQPRYNSRAAHRPPGFALCFTLVKALATAASPRLRAQDPCAPSSAASKDDK